MTGDGLILKMMLSEKKKKKKKKSSCWRFSELAPARGAPAMTSDYLSCRFQNYTRINIYCRVSNDYIVPLMLLRSYASNNNPKERSADEC